MEPPRPGAWPRADASQYRLDTGTQNTPGDEVDGQPGPCSPSPEVRVLLLVSAGKEASFQLCFLWHATPLQNWFACRLQGLLAEFTSLGV